MKFLPKVFILSTIFFVLIQFPAAVFAQVPTVSPSPVPTLFNNQTTPTPAQVIVVPSGAPIPDDSWIYDKEVTFIGKNAARSGLLLDWTLRDYNWSFIQPDSTHPLVPFWITIRNIVYALFILFIIGTSFVLIVTRGRSLAAKRFVPRFIGIVLLVTFSFSMLQFLYQVTDGIQGFFLKSDPVGNACGVPDQTRYNDNCISQKDLFYWSWDYKTFQGLRKTGPQNEESAYISLFLTKLSALTYFVMVGILLVRKIILWFFIIVSPIFPLLLLYYPVRNTGKIWIGEFFRWLFYAPLFSIFLAGLVSLWRLGIPMNFINTSQAGVPGTGVPGTDIYYPTAVNILLAGPGQGAHIGNSVNLTDTFALYLVALIMLWMVIILPWILLQIFLEYMGNMSFAQGSPVRQMVNMVSNKFPPSPIGPSPSGRTIPFGKKFEIPPTKPAPAGLAMQLPKSTGLTQQIPVQVSQSAPVSIPVMKPQQAQTEALRLTNLSLPTMRDIARFETSKLSSNITQSREVANMREKLQQIANPSIISTTTDRNKYQEVREKLIQQSQQGNIMATSILKAANIVSNVSTSNTSQISTMQKVLQNVANPERITTTVQKDQYREFKEKVVQESARGNNLATSILSVVNNLSKESTTSKGENTKNVLQQIANTNSITNTADKQRITELKEKLTIEKQNGNPLATTVLTAVEKLSTTTSEAEKATIISSINETLQKESEKGNTLATSILSATKQTDSDTQNVSVLKDKLEKEKQIGNPLAVTLLSMLAKAETDSTTGEIAIPNENRIQQVSLDDYEAVKSMWVENYNKLDVPQTSEGKITRKAWVQEDMSQISNTISLLTSNDQVKIEEGMKEVSNILPFLLIGGFSQEEIVSYLKAKLEAAKVVKTELDKTIDEEDNLIDTISRSTEASKSMHMTTSVQTPSNATQNYTSVSDDDESVLQNIQTNKTIISPVNTEILKLSSLTLPTMHDIADYEIKILSVGKANHKETQTVAKSLESIANPTNIQDATEREQFTKLKETLLKESQNGNQLAASILQASGIATGSQSNPTAALPSENRIQQVSLDDYEAVRSMWAENYKNLEVPQANGTTLDRGKWIESDISTISNTISLLTSGDQVKISEGMKEVSSILPFLLIGGFSQEEIVGYLKAKLEAAKSVKVELEGSQNAEDTLVTQIVRPTNITQSTSQASVMNTATNEIENAPMTINNATGFSQASVATSPANTEIFSLSNLKIPTLHDIAQIEIGGLQQNKENNVQTLKVTTILKEIENPIQIQDATRKDQFSKLKEILEREDQSDNPVAQSMLTAAHILGNQASSQALLPKANRIQPVSLEDYESIRKMWLENYEKLEVPQNGSGKEVTREEWLSKEIEEITFTLSLLTSSDEKQVNEGLQRVSQILPFLLLGGFSKEEIISYLKAKLEAAKAVLDSLRKTKNDQDTLIENPVNTQSGEVKSQEVEKPMPGEDNKPE